MSQFEKNIKIKKTELSGFTGTAFVCTFMSGDTGVDVKVKRIGHLVSVGMFEHGLDKKFTHFEVSYYGHGESAAVTYDIAGKQGMFFDIPEEVTSVG